ncbi:MAG TPA: TatD family hydrolase [Candidatus Paceibacterota bacterium]|nr:TatD family hydrolase [Candidatus Paceibacterota bacterium]
MKYFDAHCHIQFPQYDEDRDELIARMNDAGVGGIVVGVDLESTKKAIALVQEKPTLFASVGLHPNSADEFEGIEPYAELARDPKVVAIGECGLDNYRPGDVEAAKPLQREVFLKHVELAVTTRTPLMIHSRPAKGTQDAYHDLIDILSSAKREHGDALTGNIHFFVGGIEEARKLIELDFTLSYTAVLTFARDYDEVVRFAPLSHLITETDSPYVAPAPNRGKRNDPRAIPAIVDAIAGIRSEDSETVRVNILQNVQRVFKLPSGLFE